MSTELTGYLHHCQFPNVAYKALQCFKCVDAAGKDAVSDICSLGAEVIERAHAMYSDDTEEFNIGGLSEEQLSESIDSSASSVLALVDTCIRLYGKETVLY